MATNTSIQKVTSAWVKFTNPLRSLTVPQIERMLENARHGDDCRLQLAFTQIETLAPIYQVCIQKRLAGVTSRQWDITATDDTPEAKRQQEEVKKMLEASDQLNEDGLTEAIRHLAMATFRGRSAIKPFFTDDNKLFFKKLNNWNVLYHDNKFYWNPSSNPTGWIDDCKNTDVVELPKDEICYLVEERPVDIPGLTIYLRQLVGEEQWSRFIEKQGIPQVVLNTPDGTPDTALEMWNQRALQIFEGGSGTLPFDAKINVLDSSRGQDPFSSYIEHQMEMIAILATGGSLGTIGGSTGLGSNLADVQESQFQSLVNLDCKRISNALTNTIIKKCVKQLFGDVECKVRFSYVEQDDTTASEYLDLALKLNQLGVKIDTAELKKVTGIQFIDDSDVNWSPSTSTTTEWSAEDKAELKRQLEQGAE